MDCSRILVRSVLGSECLHINKVNLKTSEWFTGRAIYLLAIKPTRLVAKQTLTLSECPCCSQECPNRPFASVKPLFIIVTSGALSLSDRVGDRSVFLTWPFICTLLLIQQNVRAAKITTSFRRLSIQLCAIER